ncbi:MAG: enoyl-CoA hydratase/isomerase family protein [Acidobacteria bacterium]|nr:enoyl-CoA hydratase/isomerase family protein [Acidobacteriota bacterium]
MQHLQVERAGGVSIITMARGKANAIDAAMLDELHAAVAEASADASARAVVLASASTRLFSGGFDVAEVFPLERAAMAAFFDRFVGLFEALRGLPKPTVAAVSGHAYAGGAILALACDFRVMADGEFGFALNEVNLGIVLPRRTVQPMLHVCGDPTLRYLLLTGQQLPAARALASGLALELAPVEEVRARAIALAQDLSEKPPSAFAALKASLASPPMTPADRRAVAEEFAASWDGEESRSRRAAVVAAMRK